MLVSIRIMIKRIINMIEGKRWDQLSLLEVTHVPKAAKRSVLKFSNSEKLEYFPAIVLEENQFIDSKAILLPDSKLKLVWDCLSILVIMFQALYIPFVLAFELDDQYYWVSLDTCCTVYFFIDILFSLNLAIYRDGKLIKERKVIIKNYLKNWFIIDFLAISPYIITEIITDKSKPLYFKKNLRLIHLLKLLRISKLQKLIQEIEDRISSRFISSLLMIVDLICQMLYCGHVFACIFYAIGNYESNFNSKV